MHKCFNCGKEHENGNKLQALKGAKKFCYICPECREKLNLGQIQDIVKQLEN